MNRFDWLSEILACCEDEHILVRHSSAGDMKPAHLLIIDHEDWVKMAQVLATNECRWCALWADECEQDMRVNLVVEKLGDYVLVCTSIASETAHIASITPVFTPANRAERHASDLFGITFDGHPDPRRWTRHQAWAEDVFPLRKNHTVVPDSTTPPADQYPFLQAQGSGVYEIPVGPVHAGIIEPGHFRFQAVGEQILSLEQRLGYTHKGIEKIAVGRDPAGLLRLASRVSGDTAVGHAWAAAMAMERAVNVTPPPRALAVRAVLAEQERIANHIGDIGAICNDVGFSFAQSQFSRLREDVLRLNLQLFHHRLLMDTVSPGGVSVVLFDEGIEAILALHARLRDALAELMPMLNDNDSLRERLVGAGFLPLSTAAGMATLGYVGRASGLDYDVRRQHGYAPYDTYSLQVPTSTVGDVAARLQLRADEVYAALNLMHELLIDLPEGNYVNPWPDSITVAQGIGIVEGWRGEIISYVRFDKHGRIGRFYPRDPSCLNWPALEQLIDGNMVPDFPVCNKSVNGSYSGQDL